MVLAEIAQQQVLRDIEGELGPERRGRQGGGLVLDDRRRIELSESLDLRTELTDERDDGADDVTCLHASVGDLLGELQGLVDAGDDGAGAGDLGEEGFVERREIDGPAHLPQHRAHRPTVGQGTRAGAGRCAPRRWRWSPAARSLNVSGVQPDADETAFIGAALDDANAARVRGLVGDAFESGEGVQRADRCTLVDVERDVTVDRSAELDPRLETQG